MYPGLKHLETIDPNELQQNYEACLDLLHFGNYLCTPKNDFINERRCIHSISGSKHIVLEQKSKKKGQKELGTICFTNTD